MHVIVIGGGWAGLAAAVELSLADFRVTLIEAAKQAGGRARRVETRGATFDNGQHLMLGAYRELLRLLEVIGVREEQVFTRRPLRLDMRSSRRQRMNITFPALPAPWHTLAGFARAQGLDRSERFRAVALCMQLFFSGFKLAEDLSVAAWLHRARQPERLIKMLWEPLCLAAMNTPLSRASARIFIRVLHETFAAERSASDMLFPRVDLGAVFPDPALRFVKARGGKALHGERALQLGIRNERILGVTTRHGVIEADHVIVAVPPGECLRLVQAHPPLRELAQKLSALEHEPVCTLYLQYPPEIRLGCEMVGLLNGMGQWILDLGDAGHPGRMAVVISGPGEHMGLNNAALSDEIVRQIAELFPQWPAPSHNYIIREKRATFSCHSGVDALRPSTRTPIAGCWLAGDYTDTGLPATLEGALRSGVRAAREIIDSSGSA